MKEKKSCDPSVEDMPVSKLRIDTPEGWMGNFRRQRCNRVKPDCLLVGKEKSTPPDKAAHIFLPLKVAGLFVLQKY